MIKLFRNIRKKLLQEGKATGYINYAIGEIFLVVIGILIALQINSWNQGRKDRELVRIRLSELIQDLELDRSHFKYHLDLASEENHRIDSILAILGAETADQDMLMGMIRQGSGFTIRKPWVMIATTESPQLHDKTFLSIQYSGQLALFDNDLQQSIGSFYGYHRKYSLMIEEIIKVKNTIHSDFVRTIPYNPNPNSSTLNPRLMDQLWKNVDRGQAQNRFITLLNTIHELNLKSIFFNTIRLEKTQVMIDEMNSEIRKMSEPEVDQHEALTQ
jgi:hypothetical protein